MTRDLVSTTRRVAPIALNEAIGPILWIAGLGVFTRLLLLLIVNPSVDVFGGDSVAYATGARASLYSLFAMEIPWRVLIMLQCMLTIGSGVGAFLILRNVWAGLAIVACPFLAFFDFRVLSECLYVNLTFWAFLLYRTRWWSGGFLGLAILTRAIFVLLPAAVFLTRRTRQSAIFAATAFLISLPILALPPTSPGMNLWIGTWERDPQWYFKGLDNPSFPSYARVTPEESAAVADGDDGYLLHAAVGRIESNPFQVITTWAIRYPRLWIGTRSDQIEWRFHGMGWVILKCLFFTLNLSILAFGAWGLMKRPLFAIPVIYTALIYIPFHNDETRYSLAALPFLICAGILRLTQGPEMGTERNRSPTLFRWGQLSAVIPRRSVGGRL